MSESSTKLQSSTGASTPISTTSALESSLTNRGNKLTGPENPSHFSRRKLWSLTSRNPIPNEEEFEAYERVFLDKVRRSLNGEATDEEALFNRFAAEFSLNSVLFRQEGIEMKDIFKHENLASKRLSNYTSRALQNRHLQVLCTLLMLTIEREQEEYRKVMKLAEFLCVDDFRVETDRIAVDESHVKNERCEVFDGLPEEELLHLKALCHEHLHTKRLYISTLRKIRSAAIYALFQANSLYKRLRRLGNRLQRARGFDQNEEEL